jgi:hypothetical protein
LPKSSVSDFELFALKVKEHIAAKVKKSEEDNTAYRLQKEEESLQETEEWFKRKRAKWKLELTMREQQERRAISEEIDQKWSFFKKESERAIKEGLEKRLEEEFPLLAKCFILRVSKQYQTGVFIMPAAYNGLVDGEKFNLEVCQEEKIVFRQDNLYIEYSIERIMEELKDEIMHPKEDSWHT